MPKYKTIFQWGIVANNTDGVTGSVPSAQSAYETPPLLVIWDGLKAHRSRLVREYLDGLNGHIQIAFLPPYAPDMNSVEFLWAWLKRHAMANYCPNNLSELQVTARNKLMIAQKAPIDHCRLLETGYAVEIP